ncbi:MAG: DUF1002 domain-containing protein [Sarcina sp.]
MSVKKIVTSLLICGVVVMGTGSFAFADGGNVVTLGQDLSDSQKETVLKYFGVNKNEVVILEVNNAEERKYLEGVASEAQLGRRTFSCSYVEPTKKGTGINVKTVNLTYVTSSMIASTLATCGITDANVIAMSPMPVSGTGALTGVMKAFEDATGEKLDEEKKEIASEELIITGDIADAVGPDKAAGIVNDIKTEIIKDNTSDIAQIAQTIVNVTNNYNVSLTNVQKADLEKLMEKIAQQDYDYSNMKETLAGISDTIEEKLDAIGEAIDKGWWENIKSTVSGWANSIGDFFGNMFGSEDKDLGILGGTNDDLLGEDVVVDATDENAITKEKVQGFFEKAWEWFKGIFNNENSTETGNDSVTEEIKEEDKIGGQNDTQDVADEKDIDKLENDSANLNDDENKSDIDTNKDKNENTTNNTSDNDINTNVNNDEKKQDNTNNASNDEVSNETENLDEEN